MNPLTLGALQSYDPKPDRVLLRFTHGLLLLRAPFEGVIQIRVTYSGAFAPRRSWDIALDEQDRPLTLQTTATDEALIITAAPLHVTVTRRDGCVSFTDDDGRVFAQDIAPPVYEDAPSSQHEERSEACDAGSAAGTLETASPRTAVRVRKAMSPDEVYYGFGQRIGLLDRRGRTLTNWTVDPSHGHNRGMDNLYQAHPVFLALRPTLAWGFFLHSTWCSRFDVGATHPDVLDALTVGNECDYYILYGPTPDAVVEKLTHLTGRPALPPLWSLGFHQSRWGYDSADKVRDLAATFRARGIPLDTIHLDVDYMRGYRDFTWDPDRFPGPAALLHELRAHDVRVVTIIDAGVKEDLGDGYDVADDGMARDAFIRTGDGAPFAGYCWPGLALFPDFTRSDVRAWWGARHASLLDAGVAGIWNDMNEPSIFDRPFTEDAVGQRPMPLQTPQGAEGERTVHAEAHNLYGLLMCRSTYEGLRALRPDERPWILTRSGYTGLQRYAVAWMGDNNSWWEHLEASVAQLASMGLCGLPHVGVDIGGFFESASAELYARWIALGAFYPFMRSHCTREGARQEPWAFGPRVERIARQFIALRYRLLPYLYTLAHQATRTGAPLFRPMMYDFPDDPASYHLHDQVMVGPHLLVAPVCHPGRDHRAVYLPQGKWHDYWTGEATFGPQTVIAAAPLDRIPLYVRGGAALPLGNERLSTSAPLETLTLALYPEGTSAWTLIEDDGTTFDYQRGEIAETTVYMTADDGRVSVEVMARRGDFQPHPRTLAMRLRTAWRPDSVLLDGRSVDWRWDEPEDVVALSWADDGRDHRLECRIDGPQGGDSGMLE